MNIDQATKYVSDNLHQPIKVEPYEDEKKLALGIARNYFFICTGAMTVD